MGLNMEIKRVKETKCPHCGEVAGYEALAIYYEGGLKWEDFLTKIGYYQSEEWYGKDKLLTESEARAMVEGVRSKDADAYKALKSFVALALYDGDKVVINANW